MSNELPGNQRQRDFFIPLVFLFFTVLLDCHIPVWNQKPETEVETARLTTGGLVACSLRSIMRSDQNRFDQE
jgi:hypothetical protein